MATAALKARIQTDSLGEYIIVKSGDTLSQIARAYFEGNYKYPDSVNQLGTLNKIYDVDYIKVGQKIYLSKKSTSTVIPSPYKDAGTSYPTVTVFGVLANDDENRLTAVWTWPDSMKANTDKFDVEWRAFKESIRFEYKDEEVMVDRQFSSYDIPTSKAVTKVQFRVRPIPKKVKNGDKETYVFDPNLWTNWNDNTYHVVNKPDAPGTVNVSLNKLELTASIENPTTAKASIIKFQLIKDNNLNSSSTAKVAVNDSLTVISHTFKVEAGCSYTVRACANKDGNDSEWSTISSSVETMPAKVTLNDPKPVSSTSVELSWGASKTAESYTLSYVTGEKGFYEGDDGHQDVTGIKGTTYTLTVTPGMLYSFKIKAIKGQEESDWSDVKTVTLGTNPTSPTTWSSTTTAMSGEGESVALYWTHNSTDGSTQTSADITLSMEGVDNITAVAHDVSVNVGELSSTVIDESAKTVRYTVKAANSDTNPNPTHALIIQTKNYTEGAKITWCVTTTSSAGKTSDPSVERLIEIFSKPTVLMGVSNGESVGIKYYKVDYLENTQTYSMTSETLAPLNGEPVSGAFTVEGNRQVRTDTLNGETILYCIVEEDALTSLPLKVEVEVDANEAVQTPIEYLLTVSANNQYNTVDNFGNEVTVSIGQTLFSKHYTAAGIDKLDVDISAGDITLVNGESYTVKCLVAMSSGITVEAFTEIQISWSSTGYYLNSQVGYDETAYSVYLRPYCDIIERVYYKVENRATLYYLLTETYDYVYGTVLPGVFTTTGEQVYKGTLDDGTSVYYTIADEHRPVTDVLFSVYRREYDGGFTPIIEGLDAAKESFVTDPHPSLDYARYRIVAKDKQTSAITYADIANYYIGEKAIIIQWNEPHSSFAIDEDSLSSGDGTQSLLRLPYNIDVTNAKSTEVSLIKYVGRKNPVSYYGTHTGETASWKTEIPKSDIETIYALQRLQAYSGDVYVREPYGTGYWANVTVSFSKNHLETTIPVSINVTRVEGGV